MKELLSLILITICVLYGCTDNIVNRDVSEDFLLRPILFLSQTASLGSIISDEIDINNVKIIEDILLIEVSYTGGCEPHSIVLFSNSGFQESYPAQLPMRIVHHSFSDTCSQIISEKLYFDLKSVEALYKYSNGADKGKVALSIYDGDSSLYYLPQPIYEF